LCGSTFAIVGPGAVHVGGLTLSAVGVGGLKGNDGIGGDTLQEVFVLLLEHEDGGRGTLL
jgi:hypothetical protein